MVIENTLTSFDSRELLEHDSVSRKKTRKALLETIQQGIDLIDNCSLNATGFYKTKATSAAESADYFLRQRRRLLDSGYVDSSNEHWRLVNERLEQLLRLFQAFSQESNSYLFYCQDQYPLVTLWLLLNLKLDRVGEFLPVIEDIFDNVDALHWRQEVVLSHSPHIDREMMLCCLSQDHELASQSFKALVERRSLDGMLSSALINHDSLNATIQMRMHSHQAIHLNEKSKTWLREQSDELADWYVQLFCHSSPTFWWQESKEELEGRVPEWLSAIIDFILAPDTKRCLDMTEKYAPLVFALSGRNERVSDAIAVLYEELDEFEFTLWLSAFSFVFGDQLPFDVADYGLKHDRITLVTMLNNWWQPSQWPSSIRSGRSLNYKSTISVLRNPQTCSRLRKLAWYDLCISSRTYIQYSCFEYPDIQRSVLSKLEGNKEARERFDLRKKHAVMEG